MSVTFEFLVFVIVMICWLVFAGTFLLRKKPPTSPDEKRAPRSLIGVAFQGISYGIIWGVRREAFTPILPNTSVAIVTGVLASCAAIASVWLVTAALKTLGKEWSLTARLVEGHKLATTGPYALVRHPIYTGMLGMLLATGLAVSHWAALLVALVVFFVGTTIRVRSEEKLLREAFGEQFEKYALRVPAILPGLY
jgi:protein-S-isoprenylcysteine O-methyltransferase Ste14